ncbi:MAG TPA: GGDEF domain-containing protein [Solirubrobacteraceae bacterium]|nr:GGDEF domain-containing protein [Solirubrobacteraceae bacterium]
MPAQLHHSTRSCPPGSAYTEPTSCGASGPRRSRRTCVSVHSSALRGADLTRVCKARSCTPASSIAPSTRPGAWPSPSPASAWRQLHAGEPNSGPLSPQRVADLGHWFDTSGLLRGKLYDRRGRIVWSDDHAFIGQDASSHEDVREAIEGEIHAAVEDSEEELGAKGRFFEVYVPIRGGVFESYMSYEPTAKAIASDTRTLFLALGAGLLLLWLVLFRVVARASRRLRHQATHDRLTDLPNRAALHREGERTLAGARRMGTLAALLLIDLDRFKEVNDTLGHEQGDRLLIEVAHRLREVLRRSDLLARLGGDEFAVLATLPHRGALGEVATRVHAALARPFDVAGVAVELGAAIGIALQPDHGDDVSTLLRRADVPPRHRRRGARALAAPRAGAARARRLPRRGRADRRDHRRHALGARRRRA